MFIQKTVTLCRIRMLRLLLTLGCIVVLSGCVTSPKYWVLVENKGSEPLHEVGLTVDGAPGYTSKVINGGVLRGFKPELESVPSKMNLSWKDAEGQEHSYVLKDGEIPDGFRGYVYFLVSPEQDVRIFKKAAKADKAEGPWVRPAEWEGAISMPGLGQ